MTTYAALLRGINVGGNAKIGMADLRRVFGALGHTDAQTYLQSGNVIFSSASEASSRLVEDIERSLARDLGVTVTVLLRTADELAQIVANNPFLGRETDPTKLHVTFLADAPGRDGSSQLETPGAQPDELALVGREVYVHCPNGYGRTKLNNAFLEKRLGVPATTRNWRTVTTLRDLTSGG